MPLKLHAQVMLVALLALTTSSIAAAGAELDINAIDFTWSPTIPQAGELVQFTVTGVAGTIEMAQWDFDEPGCSGYPELATCTPTYTSCSQQTHKFSSAGTKTVSVVLTVNGTTLPAITRSVTVVSNGRCTCDGLSVAANFTIGPSSPVNTDPITLNAASSCIAAGATPSYRWAVTGPTSYSGCPSGASASTCTIPADSLSPGTYTFKLTLTNTENGDQSIKTISGLAVADGNVQLDFTVSPSSPDIGAGVTFRVQGVAAELSSAAWNFGGPSCPGSGYNQQTTCVPDGNFVTCKVQPYNFSTSGTKTVTLSVNVGGSTFGPVSHQVTVSTSGSCTGGGGGGGGGGGSCTYTLNPSTATYPSTGGSGTVSMSTQTGCVWNAVAGASWVTLTGASSGAGSGTIGYFVEPYTGTVDRATTISAGGKNHFVNQAAGAGGVPLAGWQKVAAEGVGEPQNTAASAMAAFGSYLYVATENPTGGLEVLRSSDGMTWAPVATGGFGDGDNIEATALVAFGGQLLLTTTNETTGCQVWQSPNGVTWTKASPDGFLSAANTSAPAMVEFAGDLYVGTSNQSSGGQVWRTLDASQWSQVNTSGFGSSTNQTVTALAGFNSQLYAGSTGFWGFRLFRRTSGLSWSQIGLDGFGDNTNTEVTALVDLGGELVLGTRNELTGGEVWSSTTGSSWSQINEDGFGAFPNQAVSFLRLYDTVLIAGAANPQSGGAVWASDGLGGWSQVSEAGFGDQYNVDLPSAAELNGTLYVGTENPFGFQIWRHVPGLLFADGFELGSAGDWSAVVP